MNDPRVEPVARVLAGERAMWGIWRDEDREHYRERARAALAAADKAVPREAGLTGDEWEQLGEQIGTQKRIEEAEAAVRELTKERAELLRLGEAMAGLMRDASWYLDGPGRYAVKRAAAEWDAFGDAT